MNFVAGLSAVERRIDQLDGTPRADADVFGRLVRTPLPSPIAPASAPALLPAELDPLIATNAAKYGVDPALVRAVIARESGGNPNATSVTGAAGLMQLMPATAESLGVGDPYDSAQNIAGGTRYLRSLLDRFGGDLPRTVAAYNAGPGAVERYDGIPPFAETQRYVADVLGSYARSR